MSGTIEYKGYRGAVLYSPEDRLLHGRILGIHDMVLYDGVDLPLLEQNFREAVDEYLEFCRIEGRAPNQPAATDFDVHVSHDLELRAARYAEQHHSQLEAVLNDALEEYLAKSA